MAAARPIQNPIYAQPVLRSASPTNTITTEYGEDETSQSDKELSDEQFAEKVEMGIGIRLKEGQACSGVQVLIQRPKNALEEKVLHEQVMRNLRLHVKALEEEELFESTAVSSIQGTQRTVPTSYDIDEIMRGLISTTTLEDRDDLRMEMNRRSPTPMTMAKSPGANAVLTTSTSVTPMEGVDSDSGTTSVPAPVTRRVTRRQSRRRG